MCRLPQLSSLILIGLCTVSLAAEPKRDHYGDPLPDGAVARLGSMRLRNDEPIIDAAFTPDGKTLATYASNSISFWDPVTGKARRRLQFKMQMRCLSADGKTKVCSRLDKPNWLIVEDASSGHILIDAHFAFIQALDVSRDGKILAAVHQASITLWDVRGAKLLHEFKGPQTMLRSSNRSIALTPDGKQLVLPHSDGSLHLIDVASGKELRAFEMPPLPRGFHPSQRLGHMALSPDGRYLAFGGFVTPLTVCELSTGKRLHDLGRPQGVISGLAFTPNGRFLAMSDYRGTHLFGVLSGKELCKLPTPPGTSNRLVFSPDGRTLAAVGAYTIKLWDVAGPRPLHPPAGHEATVQALVFFPDGKRLVSADHASGLMVWDIASGRRLAQRIGNKYALSLAVESDGAGVRYAGYDVAVHRWNLRADREESRKVVIAGLSTNTLALSPDGRSMAVFTFDRRLRMYEMKNNKSIVLPGLPQSYWVSQIAFAPDSHRLAASSNDGTLWLWDRDSGKLVREFKKEAPWARPVHLTFAADGRSLALFDDAIHIREIVSGADRLQIPRLSGTVFALAYSPDARFLACAPSDGRVVVYSAVSGKQMARWQGKQGPVRALTFSRDSRLLASGGENGTILIWEVPKEEALPAVLTAEKAVALWQALGDRDAAVANRALAALT
ncbi:MAG: hypothetical protein ACRELF_02305, partial [Gemmataceae bacterium]